MELENSIAYVRPDLAVQFDYEVNYPLTPESVSVYSKQKLDWMCPVGHKWIAAPLHRMRSQIACPICTGHVIIPGFNDLFTLYPHLEKEWHCQKNGALNPLTLGRSSNKKVWWVCSQGHEWQTAISHRTDSKKPTGCPYCKNQKVIPGVNDLKSQRPEIADEWDYRANEPLLPSQVMVHSGKLVHWQCKNGHKWKTAIAHRTDSKKPSNCPYCNRRKAIPGETDLVTLYPNLIKQWDYTLNLDLDPTRLRPNSRKIANWVCDKGHRWTATINSRTEKNRRKCPYCYGRLPIPGETDLQTRYPVVAAEWNWAKNGDLMPENISAASNKKVWWICEKGHQWEAVIASRTYQGNNCPVCSGRKPDIGVNDFATLRPDLVLDWCDERNDGKQPQNYTCNSSVIITWQCHKCGTIWRKSIKSRIQGNKCPSCYRSRFRRV